MSSQPDSPATAGFPSPPQLPLPDADHPSSSSLFDHYPLLASGPSSQQHSPLPFDDDFHFNQAFRPSPSPPLANFLDTILNPAQLQHGRYSPFAYYRPSPPRPAFPANDNMPPVTRPRLHPSHGPRPARLPNGYVDLTSTPDTPPQPRKRESPTPGPSAKRQKRDQGTERRRESAEPAAVDEVDLTDGTQLLQEIQQKQRQDAVNSQTKPEEQPTTFNTFTCVICMDNPTDLTATACGHLFCHTCLMEALIAGENRTGPGEPKRSQCPVCRKTISRSKATDIIPLLLKKGMPTQPRKKVSATPATTTTKMMNTTPRPSPGMLTRRRRRATNANGRT